MIPAVFHAAGENDAEGHQDGRACKEVANGRAPAFTRHTPWQCDGERDSGEKEEEGEDEVIEAEAGPVHVLELRGDAADDIGLREGAIENLGDDGGETENPAHVETAQGIEREQACRGGGG